ncbi:MAG: hypothetical protein AAF585_07830, partial [Verrucomicrobiota bacterium]
MSSPSFKPDWVSHPGQTIGQLLEKRRIPSNKFYANLEVEEAEAVAILLGKAVITEELASKLERFLGGTKAFWLNRESEYRSEVQRLSRELERLEEEEWVNMISPRTLIKKGWMTLEEDETVTQACLRFFGVTSISQWRDTYQDSVALAAFRQSPRIASRLAPTAVWFRRCEILAESIDCEDWSKDTFTQVLPEIRALVREKHP